MGSKLDPATSCMLTLDIEGMSCASCSARVERALAQLPGVTAASVNLASASAQVHHDPAQVGAPQLLAAVRDSGYTVLTARGELAIEGMSCASCSARVERALAQVPGVLSASVNLATARASVAYLPASTDRAALLAAVAAAGYHAAPLDGAGAGAAQDADAAARRRAGLTRMRGDVLLAALLALAILPLSMGAHFLPPLARALAASAPFPRFWDWLQLLLATLALFGPGRRFLRPGWIAWRHAAPDMNALVAAGAGIAWLYGLLVLLLPQLFPPHARALYFDSTVVVIAAVLLGKYLEELAKGRASAAIHKLAGLAGKQALRLDAQGKEHAVDAAQLQLGDHVRVRPGARIPADGRVLDGRAYVDTAMLTGEPMPQAVAPGSAVTGGTLVQDGSLVIEITAVGAATVLAQIVRMVEQAQGGKLPIQSLADRVVRVFAPLVVLIAVLAAVVWLALGQPTLALTAAVAVLVVACPCAMGLATPAAIMVGSGRAAELGVLYRKGAALEALAEVDTVLLDKTGTLTRGRPQLVARAGAGADEALRLAAALEQASEHPLARAICAAAAQAGIEPAPVADFRAHAGMGVEGRVAGVQVRVGTLRWLQQGGASITAADAAAAAALEASGHSVVYVARAAAVIGMLAIRDVLAPDAAAVCAALRARGLRLAMVTGDARGHAQAVAAALGIGEVHSELLPQDKAEVVRTLQRQGRRVAFVGDGINDAPALAQAEVGIALASGTEIAMEAADVTLSSGHLAALVTARDVARRTLGNIRGNLFWAFIYNIVLIPVAAGVAAPWGIHLQPMLAGVAMGLSSLFVLGNSLRLRRLQAFRPAPDPAPDAAATAEPTLPSHGATT